MIAFMRHKLWRRNFGYQDLMNKNWLKKKKVLNSTKIGQREVQNRRNSIKIVEKGYLHVFHRFLKFDEGCDWS